MEIQQIKHSFNKSIRVAGYLENNTSHPDTSKNRNMEQNTTTKEQQFKQINTDLNEIANTIRDEYKIDVTADGRNQFKIQLTKIFCKYSHYFLGIPCEIVGRFINRDHVTVLHACKTYDDLYFSSREFRDLADNLIGTFYNINSQVHKQPMLHACQEMLQKSSEADRARYYASMCDIRENPRPAKIKPERRKELLEKYINKND